jgi:hypothetical protein
LKPIQILHISDLHFNEEHVGSAYDHYRDIRDAAMRDVGAFVDANGAIDAILVTGDIAYAGRSGDYVFAREWLDELASRAGCVGRLRCIPGNHDVNWGTIQNDPVLRDTIQRLRVEYEMLDASNRFEEYIRNNASLMLRQFKEYNDFAAHYNSESTGAQALSWLFELELSDFSKLHVHGLNSATVSNWDDKKDPHRLLLGSFQLNWPPRDDVVCMTLSHHIRELFRDQWKIRETWVQKAPVQLFGHMHEARQQKVDDSILIIGGGLHPELDANEVPLFSYVTLYVDASEISRDLRVTVTRRTWDAQKKFDLKVADISLSVPLPPWRSSKVERMIGIVQGTGSLDEGEADGDATPDAAVSRTAEDLVDAFLQLDDGTRSRLVEKFGVGAPNDQSLSRSDLFLQLFIRLSKGNKLDAFLKESIQARATRLGR